MSDQRFLYELATLTKDPCSMTKDARKAASETWLCPGCSSVKSGFGAIDVHLQAIPKHSALNFVWGMSIGIIRTDFLEVLGEEHVSRNLKLGRVLDAFGREISGFVTFRGRFRLVIRGDKRSHYRRCEVCGRHGYSPMGKWYLLSGFPDDSSIYESQLHGLIVNQEIAERVKQKKWRDLAIVKLPILDSPIDDKPYFSTQEDGLE
jgi:hypothetical protein